jgi:hypothetical protein
MNLLLMSKRKRAAASSLMTGIQSWWKGDSVNLAIGGGPLTNVNAATFGADYAQFVAASKQNLQLATNAAVEFPNADFSLSFWYYFTSLIDLSMIITKLGATTNQEIAIYHALGIGNKLQITLYNVSGATSGGATTNIADFQAGCWYHIVIRHNATTHATVVKANNAVSDSFASATNLRGASNANFVIGGRGDNINNCLNGRMKQVGKWNRYITDAEVNNLYADGAGAVYPTFATYTPPTVTHIVYEGDSMTAGNANTPLWTYPRQAAELLGLPEQNISNLGVGSSTWADLTTRQAACDAQINAGYTRNILTVWCGFNDLRTDVRTLAQIKSDMATYCTARRAAGWTGTNKLIVGTLTPSTAADSSVNYEANRQDLNTWIRANYASWADGVMDTGADANIGAVNASNNTVYYKTDKIHQNTVGAGVVATLNAAAMNAL